MSGEAGRTLLEWIDHACAMLEASPLDNTLPMAAEGRAHRERLAREMELASGDDGETWAEDAVTQVLLRINGGPAVTP